MSLLSIDLGRARQRLNEAKDPRAKAALEGVIIALDWAIEDGGRAPPSEVAAGLRVEKEPPQAAVSADAPAKKAPAKKRK